MDEESSLPNSEYFNFNKTNFTRKQTKQVIIDLKKALRQFENNLEPEHFLFVGQTGAARSSAAAHLFQDNEDILAQSVGIFPAYSDKKLTESKLRWASKIFIINESEQMHKTQLLQKFPKAESKKMIILDIKDGLSRYDDELIEILKDKLKEYL